MIILGSVLVALGLALQTQTLWALGAVLVAAGVVLSALGTTGPRYRGRSFRW